MFNLPDKRKLLTNLNSEISKDIGMLKIFFEDPSGTDFEGTGTGTIYNASIIDSNRKEYSIILTCAHNFV